MHTGAMDDRAATTTGAPATPIEAASDRAATGHSDAVGVAASDDLLALENQVCFALAVAARGVIGVYRPILEPLGLTHPQYLVMLALWGRSPRTVRDLSRQLGKQVVFCKLSVVIRVAINIIVLYIIKYYLKLNIPRGSP